MKFKYPENPMKKLFKSYGIKYFEIAVFIGCSQSSITLYLNNKLKPNPECAEKLQILYDSLINDISGLTTQKMLQTAIDEKYISE